MGVFTKRMFPSERKTKRLNLLFNELGLPNPITPKNRRKNPEKYWNEFHQKVDALIEKIKQIDAALRRFEQDFPEFAKELPWYNERQKFLESGGVDEDALRLQVAAFIQSKKVLLHKNNLDNQPSRNEIDVKYHHEKYQYPREKRIRDERRADRIAKGLPVRQPYGPRKNRKQK